MRETRSQKRGSTRGLERLPSAKKAAAPRSEVRERAENGMVLIRKRIKYRWFTLGAGLDLPLLILICILLAVGLVMMFSASYAFAFANYGDSYLFIGRQSIFAVAGVIAMLLISTVDYHKFHRLATLIYAIAIGLLVLLFVCALFDIEAIAPNKNGATRWLNFGFMEFQPSEVAKFAMVTMLADYISRKSDRISASKGTYGLIVCLAIFGVVAGFVLLEKHFSAAIIITLLAFTLFFIGGYNPKHLTVIFIIGIAAAVLVLQLPMFSHSLLRFMGWLDPFNPNPPEGVDTWQTRQGLYAIGSGGLLGVGLGQSKQKYLYLPEPQNDFIFAIVCEELGFIGAIIVILLFAMLIWRGVYISINAKDKFGTLLGVGITFTVGIQAVLNICVVTNALPNTGISLPFFSYGGTSLLMLLGQMGVLLSISRHSNIEKT